MRIESIYSVHVLHIIVNALLGKRNIRRARLYFLPSFLKGYCVSFYLFSRHPVIFPSKRKIWNKKKNNMSKLFTTFSLVGPAIGSGSLCISIAFFYYYVITTV